MPTYNVEDTVAFDITVQPAISAVVNAAAGVDLTMYLPGPQGPKGDTGPAGPAGPEGNITNPNIASTSENNTPLNVRGFNGQLVDLAQWKTHDGKILSNVSQDGSIFARRVDGGRKSLRNLVSANNSSFEVDVSGWPSPSNMTVARSTAQAAVGSASMSMTAAAAGDMLVSTARGTSGIPITPGKVYNATALFRSASLGRAVNVGWDWYRADGSGITGGWGRDAYDNSVGWTQAEQTLIAPSDARFLAVYLRVRGVAAAEVHYVDAVSLLEMPDANLLPNPDFEVDTAGYGSPNGGTLAHSNERSAHGRGSAKITLPTANASYSGLQIPIGSVPANSRMSVSAWVYVPSGVTDVQFSTQGAFFVRTINVAEQPSAKTSVKDRWVQISGTFTTGDSAHGALYILNSSASTAGQAFFVDSVKIVVGSDVTGYSPLVNYNLARNPSFESGPVNSPDTWTKYDNLGHHTLSMVPGRDGGRAVRVTSGQPVTNSMGVYPSPYWRDTFVHGQNYVVSFYARGAFDRDTIFRIAANNTPSGGYMFLSNPVLTRDWHRYSFTMRWDNNLTIDANGFFITVWQASGTTGPSGWVEIDDVQVELGSTPTPYFDGSNEHATWDKAENFYVTEAGNSGPDVFQWSPLVAGATKTDEAGTGARIVQDASGGQITRGYLPQGKIANGTVVTFSVVAKNNGTVAADISIDANDIVSKSATVAAGAAVKLLFTTIWTDRGTPGTYRFVDLNQAASTDISWSQPQLEPRPFPTPFAGTGAVNYSPSIRRSPWELGGLAEAASTILPSSATERGLVMRGSSGQNANFLEIQTSTGSILNRIASDGSMFFNDVGGVFIRPHGNNPYTARVGHHLAVPGVLGVAGAEPNGTVGIGVASPSASGTGLIVSGVASQTGDLQQWTNSAGSILARISPSGTAKFEAGESWTANGWYRSLRLTGVGAMQFTASTGRYFGLGGSGSKFYAFTTTAEDTSAGANYWLTADGAASTINFAWPIISGSTSTPTLRVRAITSQTADLQQWQDGAGNVIASVASSGALTSKGLVAAPTNYTLRTSANTTDIEVSTTGGWARAYRVGNPAATGDRKYGVFGVVGAGVGGDEAYIGFPTTAESEVGYTAAGRFSVFNSGRIVARLIAGTADDAQQWLNSAGAKLASIANNGDMLLQRDAGTSVGRLSLGNANHGFGRGSGLNAGVGGNYVGLFTAGGTESGFSFWHATTGNLLDINGSSKAAVFAGDVKAPSFSFANTAASETAWVGTKGVTTAGTAQVVDIAQMSADAAVVLNITTMHNNGRNSYIVHATNSTNGKALVVASANQPYGPSNATFTLDAATGKIQASIAYPMEIRVVAQNLMGTTTAL